MERIKKSFCCPNCKESLLGDTGVGFFEKRQISGTIYYDDKGKRDEVDENNDVSIETDYTCNKCGCKLDIENGFEKLPENMEMY